MYKIIYQGGLKIELDKESLKKALSVWNEKRTYYDKKSDTFLSPYYQAIVPIDKDISERRIIN